MSNNSNNLKVIKVVLDKCPQKFLSSIYGFQKSCNLLSKNVTDFTSKVLMQKLWFVKIKNQVHTKFSELVLKSEKKVAFGTKADILAKSKIKSEKKTVFNTSADITSRLYFHAISAMSFVKIRIGLLAGKSKDIPALFLKALKIIRINNQVRIKLPEPSLKSEKKIAFDIINDILTNNKIKSEKRIVINNIADITMSFRTRALSSMHFVKTSIGLLAGKSREINAMALKAFKTLKATNQIHTKFYSPTLKAEKKIVVGSTTDILTGNKVTSEKKTAFKNIADISSVIRVRAVSSMGFGKTRIGIFAGKSLDMPALVLKVLKITKLQEYDGNRLMNIDNKTLVDLDFVVSE